MTTRHIGATKGDLNSLADDLHGYVDTAVDTLTAEMDRQFKVVNAKLDDITATLIRLEGKLDGK